MRKSLRGGGALRGAAWLLLFVLMFAASARPASGPSFYHSFNSSFTSSQAGADEAGLRLLLPSGGAVRVENTRGGVSVEVWGESFVSVSAEVENGPAGAGDAPERRAGATRASGRAASRRAAAAKQANAPVRVERSENLLSLVVPRDFGTAATRVRLLLRVPREARLRINASGGEVEVRGLPAALDAQTVGGDIRLAVPADASADLTAHSLNGEVSVADFNGGAPRTTRGKFQTRLGAGGNAARLFSGRGRISLDTLSPSEALAASGVSSVPSPRAELTSSVAPRNSASQTSEDDERQVALAGSTPAPRRAPVLVGSGTRPAADDTTRPPAPRSQDEPQEVDEDEVVRVETELVTLNVSVVERAGGRGLKGLTASDFKLYEDGEEQRVEHFETSAAPFDLLLLVDLSGSTARVTNLIRASALRFVEAARPQDRIAVLTFAGSTNVVSPLTTDRAALRAAVGSMEPPKGDTRLYDAVGYALEYFDR
ncbi:MAG TPA: VWA domain-containing protein, partial [Pyrinomonadaceae bacterium]|nr:VWA domain-containing protein [Pyrinomonadaceae bacterium]